jgi:hypothetical protein
VILLVSLGFTVGGVLMLRGGRQDGWFVAIVFGASTLVAVGLVVLRGSLTIGDDGLTVTNLGRSNTWRWSDIAGFGVMQISSHPFARKSVGMRLIPKRQTVATRFAAGLSGYDGALPDTYGLKAEDLVALLERRLRSVDRQ